MNIEESKFVDLLQEEYLLINGGEARFLRGIGFLFGACYEATIECCEYVYDSVTNIRFDTGIVEIARNNPVSIWN